jgi:hypothetical protein
MSQNGAEVTVSVATDLTAVRSLEAHRRPTPVPSGASAVRRQCRPAPERRMSSWSSGVLLVGSAICQFTFQLPQLLETSGDVAQDCGHTGDSLLGILEQDDRELD